MNFLHFVDVYIVLITIILLCLLEVIRYSILYLKLKRVIIFTTLLALHCYRHIDFQLQPTPEKGTRTAQRAK